MEKFLLILVVLFGFSALQTFSQDTYSWVSIDCGAKDNYNEDGIQWENDDAFIKTGKNKMVPSGAQISARMNSLRYFTDQNKNCYILPTPEQGKYLLRAEFYYGNYDGRSKPPTFDLLVDENKWATIVTLMNDDSVVQEAIYVVKRENVSICLARTRDDEFPFISSLEAVLLASRMYKYMNINYAWFTQYRVRFGGTEVVRYPDDIYNRIWMPVNLTDLHSVVANSSPATYNLDDYPPVSVIIEAVEALNSSDPIILTLDFPETERTTYVSLYFTEVFELELNQSRNMDIYIDGQLFYQNLTLVYDVCNEVYGYTDKAKGPMEVKLSPTETSTLPPIISAMEVYLVSDILVSAGTSEVDISGLETLASSFVQLQSWTGEPCIPNNTAWEWLRCNYDDPPRVTALNLSSYGLDGTLPTFNQMQELETIDLHNNSLDGEIPDFLGKLPNLRLLNLADNNFSGNLPQSLAMNKKISFHGEGNKDLILPKKKSKTGVIVGSTIGGAAGLVILCFLIWVCVREWKRRREPPSSTTNAAETTTTTTATTTGNGVVDQSSVSLEEQSQQLGNGISQGEVKDEFEIQRDSELGMLQQQHATKQ